ncbi:MAG: cysteine desulfurase family protein [Acidimicrobiales bacterium]
MPAYLDHSASTPMRPEAIEAMLPWLTEHHANPSGAHRLARQARRALDDARETMAEALGAQPGEIVFTSGGTEADNLAVLGTADRRGGVLVCAATEHHAVLDPVLARGGRVVAVGPDGLIDLDALAAALDPDVTLVSVMLANNEVGTVQPLTAVADVVRAVAPEARLHTDAVQALSWLDVATLAAPADLVSVSAHKFGGPKGVGALVVRDGVDLAARQLGGGQERERRGGTPDVAGIVAMATAAASAVSERPACVERVGRLRDRLVDGLLEVVPDLVETGVTPSATGGSRRRARIAGTGHVCIPGVESEALLFLLEQHDVYASAASSCSSGAMEPSHVLEAMGIPRQLAFGSLRLSLGWSSTDADVDLALDVLPPAIERLRQFAAPTPA